MPYIYNVKDTPLNELLQKAPAFKFDPKWSEERKKLYYWYYTMATGQLIRELNEWSKGFHLTKPPKFTYTGTLGYEPTLTSVKLVSIDFGSQEFKAFGFPQLLKQIAEQTGYRYFPLIIDVGSSISIAVHPDMPKHSSRNPALTLDYKATGYFFTRGWDPLGDAKAIDEMMKKAETLVLNPKKKTASRDEAAAEAKCPLVLYYYKPALGK